MTNDDNKTTSDLTDRELLALILRRLDALEALVEDRLRDTRPLWQGFNNRFDRIEERLVSIENDMIGVKKELRSLYVHNRMVLDDIGGIRRRQDDIEKLADNVYDRVEALEQKGKQV